jgi:hypothetical protein
MMLQVLHQVGNGMRPEIAPDSMPEPLVKLLQDTWVDDPEHRPNVDALVMALKALNSSHITY